MLELQAGRPQNTDGRQDREIRSYDFLDRIGVNYERIDHAPADSMEVCAEIDKSLNAVTCKNLFLCNRQKTSFYLLLIPGFKKFLTKDISKQINSARLSFAGEEELLNMMDLLPGSITILGLMNDPDQHIRLLIDEEVLKCDHIGFHPCANTTTLRVAVADLMDKIIPALQHEPTIVSL